MKNYSVIIILVLILIVVSCGRNKGMTSDPNLLIGVWEYKRTICPLHNKIGQADEDINGYADFQGNGTGTLYYNNYAAMEYATFRWTVSKDQLDCKFLENNFYSENSLEELSNMYSGQFTVSDLTFLLFDGEPSSSCFTSWRRFSDN